MTNQPILAALLVNNISLPIASKPSTFPLRQCCDLSSVTLPLSFWKCTVPTDPLLSNRAWETQLLQELWAAARATSSPQGHTETSYHLSQLPECCLAAYSMTDLWWGALRQHSFFLPSWHSPNLPLAPLKADPHLRLKFASRRICRPREGAGPRLGSLALISKWVTETQPSLLPLREPVLLGGTAVPPRPGSPS